jgi:hypothetical protein
VLAELGMSEPADKIQVRGLRNVHRLNMTVHLQPGNCCNCCHISSHSKVASLTSCCLSCHQPTTWFFLWLA